MMNMTGMAASEQQSYKRQLDGSITTSVPTDEPMNPDLITSPYTPFINNDVVASKIHDLIDHFTDMSHDSARTHGELGRLTKELYIVKCKAANQMILCMSPYFHSDGWYLMSAFRTWSDAVHICIHLRRIDGVKRMAQQTKLAQDRDFNLKLEQQTSEIWQLRAKVQSLESKNAALKKQLQYISRTFRFCSDTLNNNFKECGAEPLSGSPLEAVDEKYFGAVVTGQKINVDDPMLGEILRLKLHSILQDYDPLYIPPLKGHLKRVSMTPSPAVSAHQSPGRAARTPPLPFGATSPLVALKTVPTESIGVPVGAPRISSQPPPPMRNPDGFKEGRHSVGSVISTTPRTSFQQSADRRSPNPAIRSINARGSQKSVPVVKPFQTVIQAPPAVQAQPAGISSRASTTPTPMPTLVPVSIPGLFGSNGGMNTMNVPSNVPVNSLLGLVTNDGFVPPQRISSTATGTRTPAMPSGLSNPRGEMNTNIGNGAPVHNHALWPPPSVQKSSSNGFSMAQSIPPQSARGSPSQQINDPLNASLKSNQTLKTGQVGQW